MLPAMTPRQWEILRQPGQKLVDNTGQIHTVRSWVEAGGERYVILEEAVKTLGDSRGLIKQVVYTPQVPASVFLLQVKP